MNGTKWAIPLLVFSSFLVAGGSGTLFPAPFSPLVSEADSGTTRIIAQTPSLPQAVLKYAERFFVTVHQGYTTVSVAPFASDPGRRFEYHLVPADAAVPPGLVKAGGRIVRIPVSSCVTMSTTYLSFLDFLGMTDSIVGHDSLKAVWSPAVRGRIATGKIREVGSGSRTNTELLLLMEPDVVFTYAVGLPEWDAEPILARAGLPVVLTAESLEQDPLGRAEWIKFFALFFGKAAETEAARIFGEIEAEYLRLKGLAASEQERPTVLLNNPWQGTWYLPGGGGYLARLIADAGGDYLWKDTEGTGSFPVSLETVIAKGGNAEFWLNVTWGTLGQARAQEPRCVLFDAFLKGRVYHQNGAVTPEGGNGLYELGAARPDLVLSDYIAILHPDLLPGHRFTFLGQLR